jgi:hypothetical protein
MSKFKVSVKGGFSKFFAGKSAQRFRNPGLTAKPCGGEDEK